jgi:hypothetical protein
VRCWILTVMNFCIPKFYGVFFHTHTFGAVWKPNTLLIFALIAIGGTHIWL